MAVLVVCVRKVGVIVTQRLMPVPVRVGQARYARQDSGVLSVMLMLVVRVVFVRVPVFVPFAQVQPDTNGHAHAGHQQRCGHGLTQAQHRHQACAPCARIRSAPLVHRFTNELTNEIDGFVRQARRKPQP